MQMKTNEDRKNREKHEEKLDISISNQEIGSLTFLSFIAFSILVMFKNVLCIIHVWSLVCSVRVYISL